MEKIDIVVENASGAPLVFATAARLEQDGGTALVVVPRARLSQLAVYVMLVTGKGLMQVLAYSKVRLGGGLPQGFVLLHGRVAAVFDRGEPMVEDFAVATGPDYRGAKWGTIGRPQHIRRSAEMLRELGQDTTSPSG